MERDRIVAVDFDGTLCESKYPEIGEANQALIDHLIFRKNVTRSLFCGLVETEKNLMTLSNGVKKED